MKNTVTEKITTATVPLDPWGNCLWCAEDPGSILCCKGDHPDRYAAERDYRRAPVLDTPEARWAYVLTLWHTHSLPTPDSITVDGSSTSMVWLPQNERGQVDRWLAALGRESAQLHSPSRDGQPNRMAHYAAITSGFHIACYMDLTADADAHGGPVVRPELAIAAENVAAMLVDEPNPVCNKHIRGEQYCALDDGHSGRCKVLGIVDTPDGLKAPRLADVLAWLNEQPRGFDEILDQPWADTVSENVGRGPSDVELADGLRLTLIGGRWMLVELQGGGA